MRRRRDPFARVTYVPVRERDSQCAECGAADRSRATPTSGGRHYARIYAVYAEHDGGRTVRLCGTACSWSCLEAYQGQRIGR